MKIPLTTNLKPYEVIHAFDPGGRTGYARIRIDRARRTLTIEAIAEFPTWSRVDEIIGNLNTETECVVYESFQLRIISAVLIPVEVIGVIRFLCLNKYHVAHFGQPAHHQKATKGPLPVECWYPFLKNFSSHHASAVKHGIFFCVARLLNNQLYTLVADMKELMKNFEDD